MLVPMVLEHNCNGGSRRMSPGGLSQLYRAGLWRGRWWWWSASSCGSAGLPGSGGGGGGGGGVLMSSIPDRVTEDGESKTKNAGKTIERFPEFHIK